MAKARGASGRGIERGSFVHDNGWPEWADTLAAARLRKPLRANRVGHAYLLSGPRGVGKSDLARAFAQAICCTEKNASDPSQPCGSCRACRNVARGAHPDVELTNLETQSLLADKSSRGASLSIETIRQLRGSAALLPLEAPRRILIIDDAEMLQETAQQALLKTLEEPPPALTILVLCDEQDRLLETVRSRCQQIVVRPTSEAVIDEALRQRGLDPELAAEIAVLSRGCPGWAMSAAGDHGLLRERRSEWEAAQSWIDAAPYDRLTTAFRFGEQYGKRPQEILGIVQAVVHVLRQEMFRQLGIEQRSDELLSATDGLAATPLALSRAVGASLQCLFDLGGNVRPRLALEAMVMSWPKQDPPRS